MATQTPTTAEKIVRKLGHYKRAAREMAARIPELTEQYPDQWVALYHDDEESRLLAASTQQKLLRKIDDLGLDRGVVAMEFLSTEKRTFIL